MSRRSIFRLGVLGTYLRNHIERVPANWPVVGVVRWNSAQRQFDLWAPSTFPAVNGELLVNGTKVKVRELKLE